MNPVDLPHISSGTNFQAHEPRNHIYKMKYGTDNPDVTHFLQRLRDTSIGLTFFRFFVIEKTTLLTVSIFQSLDFMYSRTDVRKRQRAEPEHSIIF